ALERDSVGEAVAVLGDVLWPPFHGDLDLVTAFGPLLHVVLVEACLLLDDRHAAMGEPNDVGGVGDRPRILVVSDIDLPRWEAVGGDAGVSLGLAVSNQDDQEPSVFQVGHLVQDLVPDIALGDLASAEHPFADVLPSIASTR